MRSQPPSLVLSPINTIKVPPPRGRGRGAVGVSPFEQLEDRKLFSVLAHYYNDSFWGTGGRPASPTNGNTNSHAFPNQTISVARAGDVIETVPNVDFDWGTGSPNAAIRTDNFSTLFVGKVAAP